MSGRSTASNFAWELSLKFYRQDVASYYGPYKHKKEYLSNQVLGYDDLMLCDMIKQGSYFSNSLIIHEEKPKEIITMKDGWIPDPNYHKIWWTFAFNYSKNY